MQQALIILTLLLALASLILLVLLLLRQKKNSSDAVIQKLGTYEALLAQNEERIQKAFGQNRQELTSTFTNFSGLLDKRLQSSQDAANSAAKANREELTQALKNFQEQFSDRVRELQQKQDLLTKTTGETLEKVRASVEKKLGEIQHDNSEKLEKMRETVDEKLQKTLEARLGESFKLVSERLEQVQKGLGEMQNLANDVGGLKRVLSNVKSKGVLGEYQLEAILEEIMSPQQYERNVKPIPGSNNIVEFAVKIPSRENSEKVVWLPLDAKFPTEDYDRLMTAYEAGSTDEIETNRKLLQDKIKVFAREIRTKYIEPPYTTDFAILYLPFEGLYAEVLRIPGLFEFIQSNYKITIAGPTTIAAFLNSLQMGFRSLAVEKRTSEIWDLLGAVRTEFGKFGDVLEKTKQKLESASKEIDNAGVRTRAIERKLRDVQELPEGQAAKLLDGPGSAGPGK